MGGVEGSDGGNWRQLYLNNKKKCGKRKGLQGYVGATLK